MRKLYSYINIDRNERPVQSSSHIHNNGEILTNNQVKIKFKYPMLNDLFTSFRRRTYTTPARWCN